MRKFSKTAIASTVLASSVLLSGCGLLGGEEKTNKEIDPPVTFKEGTESKDTKNNKNKDAKEVATDTVKRELYLIDKNGKVVPQTLDLPKTPGVAKQVIEYLVDGGPVSQLLPDGFRAVIPRDTTVSVTMEGETLVADFSKEFNEYQPEDELRILQAITWTATQFDNVKNVELRVNGHKLEEMQVNGTPINGNLSRADGINLDSSEVVDITNTKPVTVYYVAQSNGKDYYVPVTVRVPKSEKDNIAAVVKELVEGPGLSSTLVSGFHEDVKLLDTKYENGKVTLDFNKAIFGSFDENMISKHVLNTLVLSLTEQPGVESVSITVDGNAELVSEDGKKLSEPVTRPENVNTGSF